MLHVIDKSQISNLRDRIFEKSFVSFKKKEQIPHPKNVQEQRPDPNFY